MSKKAIIDIEVLPEVFSKVLKAKEMLASGVAKNSSDAARLCDLSRSAFYKYKDKIVSYSEHHVINFKVELLDKAGMLSELLSKLYKFEANILTLNQGIPSNNVATITISARIDTKKYLIDDILSALKEQKGVVSIKSIV